MDIIYREGSRLKNRKTEEPKKVEFPIGSVNSMPSNGCHIFEVEDLEKFMNSTLRGKSFGPI